MAIPRATAHAQPAWHSSLDRQPAVTGGETLAAAGAGADVGGGADAHAMKIKPKGSARTLILRGALLGM
jgi:hypothetical protein